MIDDFYRNEICPFSRIEYPDFKKRTFTTFFRGKNGKIKTIRVRIFVPLSYFTCYDIIILLRFANQSELHFHPGVENKKYLVQIIMALSGLNRIEETLL